MDELCAFLELLCEMQRLGGRVTRIGNDAVVVTNLACWTENMTEDLMMEYPDVRLEVRSSSASLGGFELRIRRPGLERDRAMCWVCIHSVLIACIAYLMGWVPSFSADSVVGKEGL